MRIGVWRKVGSNGGIFASTTVGRHARRAAGSGGANVIALLLFVALLVGAWLLLR